MTATTPKSSDQFVHDRRLTYSGITWEQFKLIQAGFEGAPGIRLAFYNEEIELFMPGLQHEQFSEIIGYLVTTFLLTRGVVFIPSGAMNQEKEGEASAQADKSYCIGKAKLIPDLSIEVIFTSGGTKKLVRYQALGVPEVWFWEDGVLTLYHLRPDGYERIDRSELPELEQLDIELLRHCILIAETDFAQAVQTFQQQI